MALGQTLSRPTEPSSVLQRGATGSKRTAQLVCGAWTEGPRRAWGPPPQELILEMENHPLRVLPPAEDA